MGIHNILALSMNNILVLSMNPHESDGAFMGDSCGFMGENKSP